jgi:hypothetical protein
MTRTRERMKKTQVKIDKTCKHFLYHHCLATQSVAGCAIVQFCDVSAEWCKKGKE